MLYLTPYLSLTNSIAALVIQPRDSPPYLSGELLSKKDFSSACCSLVSFAGFPDLGLSSNASVFLYLLIQKETVV
jgi:hypothetical protein